MPRPLEHPCNFDPVEHAYYDVHNRTHRSVTQILADAGCVDYTMVDPDVLKAAADRGTRVHHATALWDKLRGLLPLGEFMRDYHCDLEIHPYLRQYEKFLVDTHFTADEGETERPRLVSIQGVIVGMTPDRIGRLPRPYRGRNPANDLAPVPVIVDLKTGIEQKSHALQVAGYSLGIESSVRLAMLHHRYALYLDTNTYYFARHPHQQDYYAFLDALKGGGQYLDEWKNNQQRILA